MMTNLLNLTLLFSLLTFCFCAVEETNIDGSESIEVAQIEQMEITGQVKSIDPGKDGYIARIQNDTERYNALFSMVNLNGPENFFQLKMGDLITVEGDNQIRGNENHLKVTKIIKVNNAIGAPVVLETSFEGIFVGDPLAEHADLLKKEVLKTSEGTNTAYRISNRAYVVAYALPDPNNESLVGDIIVTSIGAKTKKGIEVGDPYEKLFEMSSIIDVHGSEIEGRTYAKVGNLSYRLDIANFSYEVDENNIPMNTKIKEILINR